MQDIGILKQALPFLRRFKDAIFVLKFGGEAIRTPEQMQNLSEDISFLYSVGIRVVVVHGGGAQVTELENKLGATSRKVAGRRVTDEGSLGALKMALAGSLNIDLVAALRANGVNAVGISAASGSLIEANRRPPTKVSGSDEVVDFGYVGDVVKADATLLRVLLDKGYLPIVSPLSVDASGQILNINADTVACRLASDLKAEKLLLMTDKPGVMTNVDDPTTLISQISAKQAKQAISQGMINGGMIPKIEEALESLSNGVQRVHILSGVEPHMLLVEIFTESGCGTMVIP